MSRAQEILDSLDSLLEADKKIKFDKKIKVETFVSRRKVDLPPGEYLLVGPDEEDPKTLVVIKDPKSKDLFIIKKGLLPKK